MRECERERVRVRQRVTWENIEKNGSGVKLETGVLKRLAPVPIPAESGRGRSVQRRLERALVARRDRARQRRLDLLLGGHRVAQLRGGGDPAERSGWWG